jgi:hypothetical protein
LNAPVISTMKFIYYLSQANVLPAKIQGVSKLCHKDGGASGHQYEPKMSNEQKSVNASVKSCRG